jgi:hypothetical protein
LPITTAACDPTLQASACRSQNDPTSVTVAFAADTASMALTLTFGVGCDPALGSNARMTVSQNAIRKRNRMLRFRLGCCSAYCGRCYQRQLKCWFVAPNAFCRYSARINNGFSQISNHPDLTKIDFSRRCALKHR